MALKYISYMAIKMSYAQSSGESFSTIQSIDSLRPDPVVAEHLNKAQSRSFILARPKI